MEKKPCSIGCTSHVSHPCEKCGQQWGSSDIITINYLAEEFCLVGEIENILINPSTTENKIKDIFKIIESERLKRAENELGFALCSSNDKTRIVEYIKGRHEQVIEMINELEANDD